MKYMINTENREFQNQLRRYRKLRGLTQREVSTILGFKSASKICRWENGVATPSLVSCIKLAVLYSTWVDGLYIDLVREIRTEVHTQVALWMDHKDGIKKIRGRPKQDDK